MLSGVQQSSALRTMLSRSEDYTSTSAAPPPDHLTASLLSALFDRLKTLPEAESTAKLYKEYNVSEAKMNQLRRWVNSPSVDADRTQVILTEDGEESVKMMVSNRIRRFCRDQSYSHSIYSIRLFGLTGHRHSQKLCQIPHEYICINAYCRVPIKSISLMSMRVVWEWQYSPGQLSQWLSRLLRLGRSWQAMNSIGRWQSWYAKIEQKLYYHVRETRNLSASELKTSERRC